VNGGPIGRGSARESFRSRRPQLASKSVAGVGDPGPRPAAAATPSTYWTHWLCLIALASVTILFIVSCSNLAPPPEVSQALVANARPDHADANVLATGRKLFVSRCLECHTLPSTTKHSRDEWPHLVTQMSGRANLSVAERAAITAYLRAASVTGSARP
jgi:mono/diheme cytochrome c family protein